MADSPLTLAGDHCIVHSYHWPPILETVVHHIQPKGMGGPDTEKNKVRVCDNGHRNIHNILRRMVNVGKAEGFVAGVDGTRKEIEIAKRGFLAWDAAGRPGG